MEIVDSEAECVTGHVRDATVGRSLALARLEVDASGSGVVTRVRRVGVWVGGRREKNLGFSNALRASKCNISSLSTAAKVKRLCCTLMS